MARQNFVWRSLALLPASAGIGCYEQEQNIGLSNYVNLLSLWPHPHLDRNLAFLCVFSRSVVQPYLVFSYYQTIRLVICAHSEIAAWLDKCSPWKSLRF